MELHKCYTDMWMFFTGVRCATPDWSHPYCGDTSMCLLEWALSLSLPWICPSRWARRTNNLSMRTLTGCSHSYSCPLFYFRRSRGGGEGRQCDGGVWWWRQRSNLPCKHQASASRISNPLWVLKNMDEKMTKNRPNDWRTERQRDILPFNTSLSGAEPSPALLSPGRRSRQSSTQEKKDTPTEKPANEVPARRPQEKRPGETSRTLIYCWVQICSFLINYYAVVNLCMCMKDWLSIL